MKELFDKLVALDVVAPTPLPRAPRLAIRAYPLFLGHPSLARPRAASLLVFNLDLDDLALDNRPLRPVAGGILLVVWRIVFVVVRMVGLSPAR